MNHFEEYQSLNQSLLQFIITGESDSDDADTVRDMMDIHWGRMSKEEQKLARTINESQLA